MYSSFCLSVEEDGNLKYSLNRMGTNKGGGQMSYVVEGYSIVDAEFFNEHYYDWYMFAFASFLTEQKNLHMEHLEDEVLNGGVEGTRGAINFLQGLRDMLAGSSASSVDVTVKWDGAPAVFAGINPENDQFFVGTKGVFAKNAKINYTDTDTRVDYS